MDIKKMLQNPMFQEQVFFALADETAEADASMWGVYSHMMFYFQSPGRIMEAAI